MKHRPILVLSSSKEVEANVSTFAETVSRSMDFETLYTDTISIGKDLYSEFDILDIDIYVEQLDVAMVIVPLESNKKIQYYLNLFRKLRVPYIFIKRSHSISFTTISVPVTYLEEDKEKAPFASSFSRFLGSSIIIYKPNDYGTKAERHIESFVRLFTKFELDYTIRQSKKNSEKLEIDVTKRVLEDESGLVIVSASREYGLDDILFGPKEKKIVSQSAVPVMIINPRADLYMLCD